MTPKGLPPFKTAPVASLVFWFFQKGAEQVSHSNIIKQRGPVTPERVCLPLKQHQWPPLFFSCFNRVLDKFPLKKK